MTSPVRLAGHAEASGAAGVSDGGPRWWSVAAGSVGLLLPVALFGLVYAADRWRDSDASTPLFFLLLGAALWVAVAGLPFARAHSSAGRGARGGRAWLWARACVVFVLGVAAVAALLSAPRYQGMELYPYRPPALWIGLWVWVGSGLALFWERRPWWWEGLWLCGGALWIRAFGPSQWVLDPALRDMLPLIQVAAEALLQGENPYQLYAMQAGKTLPLTYPPFLWLAHVPAIALGLDLRWTAWVVDVLLVALVLRWIAPCGGRVRAFATLVLATYLYLPDTHWNAIYAEPHVDWLVGVGLAQAVARDRWRQAGLWWGVGLATRPFFVLWVPLLVVYGLRRWGWRRLVSLLVITGVVAGALYLPFVVADPEMFYFGTVTWLLYAGPAYPRMFDGMIGWTWPMTRAGLTDWMPWLQAGSVGLGAVLVWWARTPAALLSVVAVVKALFIAFNSLVWMSFWIPVVWLAAIAQWASGAPLRERVAPPFPLPVVLPLALGVALVAGHLVLLLQDHRTSGGREEAVAWLSAHWDEELPLLDTSAWRLQQAQPPGPETWQAAWAGRRVFGSGVTLRAPRVIGALAWDEPALLWLSREGVPQRGVLSWLGDAGSGFALFEARCGGAAGPLRWACMERRVAPLGRRWASSPGSWRVVEEDALRQRAPWEEVTRRSCVVEGQRRSMIWAHPRQGEPLRVALRVPEGAVGLTLWGGVEDRAQRWRLAPVTWTLRRPDGAVEARGEWSERAGVEAWTVGVPPAVASLELWIEAEPIHMRHLCIDGQWWGSAGDGGDFPACLSCFPP